MSNTMNYRGYTASMIFDTDDKIIVSRVMDIDDIISFHGDSVGKFEANFHSVIDDYVTACEQTGAAPEKPASGKLMRPDRTRCGPGGRRPQRRQPQQVGRKDIEFGE